MVRLRTIYDQKIGIRTMYKTLYLYSKEKKYSQDRGFKDFLVNGNSRILLQKTSKIINKGSFCMGVSPSIDIVPTKQPCVLQMLEKSVLIINGRFNTESGVIISVFKDATLEVGANVIVSYNSRILCFENIKIGNDSLISWDVEVKDSDLHNISREGFVMSKPIQIGNHVLIGSRAMILKGVRIGDGAVVAAGAVVTRDVPENCLVAGVPARVVRENIKWSNPPYGEFKARITENQSKLLRQTNLAEQDVKTRLEG
jgi:acetyltransferase-like isoleucine patch superfamily enzyme